MTVPTDLLRMLHEKYLEVYGTDHIDSSAGMVTVPGVVQAADGNIYPALLDIDACSSGEHWGTNFFTPRGVLSDQSKDKEAYSLSRLAPYLRNDGSRARHGRKNAIHYDRSRFIRNHT